jgi:hypothetical protein
MKAYNVPNKEARMRHLVRTAVGKGVISNADGVYRFGSYTLGVDEESVIGKLTNEKEVLEMIESRIGFVDTESVETKPDPKEKAHNEPQSVTMDDLNRQAKGRKPQS